MITVQNTVPVVLSVTDPISRAGLYAALRGRHEVKLIDEIEVDERTVIVTMVDRLDDTVIQHLRVRYARGQTARLVLITTDLADPDLLAAVELGVRAVVLRADATPDHLVKLIRTAASGEATLPPDLLGRLLTQVSRLQREVLTPRGLSFAGLSERELEVLRLVAQGLNTGEIAVRLSYSQRTIKTVLHDVVNRFQVRNRTQAVVYAMREGLI